MIETTAFSDRRTARLHYFSTRFDEISPDSAIEVGLSLDFVTAQALWSDRDRLEIPARSLDEPRVQVIGRIGDQVWSAFITVRDELEASTLPQMMRSLSGTRQSAWHWWFSSGAPTSGGTEPSAPARSPGN